MKHGRDAKRAASLRRTLDGKNKIEGRHNQFERYPTLRRALKRILKAPYGKRIEKNGTRMSNREMGNWLLKKKVVATPRGGILSHGSIDRILFGV